jgi:Rrf2 family protein
MVSNKCIYGLRAVLELARRHGSGPVTIAEIATSQEIPVRFLEAILRELKQAGVTDSRRGKEGGYSLARHPAEVSMGDVVRLFEGPKRFEEGNGESPARPTVFTAVWDQARQALDAVYDRTTFQTLVEEDDRLRDQQARNYTI